MELPDVVAFYRELGFFPDTEPAEVIEAYLRDWGQPPRVWQAADEAILLSYSESRAWRNDTEVDVCAGSEAYTWALVGWGEVSEGAFAPEEIREHWESDSGPITLTFTAGGMRRELHPDYMNDWLDVGILEEISKWLPDRSYAVYLDGQNALVLCLTPDERERIERVRGMTFEW